MVHSWNSSTLEAELEAWITYKTLFLKNRGAGDLAFLYIFSNDHNIENSIVIGR